MTNTDIFDRIYKRFCTEYSDSSRDNCERCPLYLSLIHISEPTRLRRTEYSDSSRDNCERCPLYRPCAMCECMPDDYWTLPDDKAEQIFKQGLTEALAAYDAQR